ILRRIFDGTQESRRQLEERPRFGIETAWRQALRRRAGPRGEHSRAPARDPLPRRLERRRRPRPHAVRARERPRRVRDEGSEEAPARQRRDGLSLALYATMKAPRVGAFFVLGTRQASAAGDP